MSLLRGFRFGSREKSQTPEKQGRSVSRNDSDRKASKPVERSETFTLKYSDLEEQDYNAKYHDNDSKPNYNTYTRKKGYIIKIFCSDKMILIFCLFKILQKNALTLMFWMLSTTKNWPV